MHACINANACICMYVCMYVCIFVCVCVFGRPCAEDRVQKKHASREILKRRDESSGFRVFCFSNHHEPVGLVYRERTPRVLAARLRQKMLRTWSDQTILGCRVGATRNFENSLEVEPGMPRRSLHNNYLPPPHRVQHFFSTFPPFPL